VADRVTVGEIRLERAPAKIKACGLGSCVAVALYDPQSRLGALGHMLLPKRPDRIEPDTEGKYVDSGIRQMYTELIRAGAGRDMLVAKVAGGANMFESVCQTLISSIGCRNARSARQTLTQLGIPLVAEETGGNRGRTVIFDLATGQLSVFRTRDDEEDVL
jgi:chemotaxis protein CheD